jgi:hypothetical protein
VSAATHPPRLVPTLTEVVDVHAAPPAVAVSWPAWSVRGDAAAVSTTGWLVAPKAGTVLAPGAAEPQAGPLPVDELAQRVLAELQPQIDRWLAQHLHDALGQALARLTEALCRELRLELAPALQTLVAHAVLQELTRDKA